MKMYSTAYITLCNNDPENPLVKAMEAERKAQDAFEEAVGGRVSKHSIASMVAFAKTPKGVRVWKNEKFRLTERLLPLDLKDTGEHKKVERYFLPCDASGKPLEGSKPVKKISKGSRLYKFEAKGALPLSFKSRGENKL